VENGLEKSNPSISDATTCLSKREIGKEKKLRKKEKRKEYHMLHEL
jgi:hypothetical protein